MKHPLLALACMLILAALALLASSLPLRAQSGGPGAWDALATQSALDALATRSAIDAASSAAQAQARAAQAQAQAQAAAAQATRQASEMQAQQQSQQATVNAALMQATLSAQATKSAAEAAAAATAQAQAAQATTQAINAQATVQAAAARATVTAYELANTQNRERTRLSLALLYAVALVLLVGCAYVIATWARKAADQVTRPVAPAAPPKPSAAAVAGDVVIDIAPMPLPALPSPRQRMSAVRIIDDPRIIEAAVRWFEGQDENGDEHTD